MTSGWEEAQRASIVGGFTRWGGSSWVFIAHGLNYQLGWIKISSRGELWYRVVFLTVPTRFQYQKENCQSANHSCCFSKSCYWDKPWLAAWPFSFWYWNWVGTVKKNTLFLLTFRRHFKKTVKLSQIKIKIKQLTFLSLDWNEIFNNQGCGYFTEAKDCY